LLLSVGLFVLSGRPWPVSYPPGIPFFPLSIHKPFVTPVFGPIGNWFFVTFLFMTSFRLYLASPPLFWIVLPPVSNFSLSTLCHLISWCLLLVLCLCDLVFFPNSLFPVAHFSTHPTLRFFRIFSGAPPLYVSNPPQKVRRGAAVVFSDQSPFNRFFFPLRLSFFLTAGCVVFVPKFFLQRFPDLPQGWGFLGF